MGPDTFHMRVAGTSFRQADVAKTKVGQRAELVPEPDNPHDANAIRVMVAGRQIGYVPGDQAEVLGAAIANCYPVTAVVEGVSRPQNSPYIGVLLELTVDYPPEP